MEVSIDDTLEGVYSVENGEDKDKLRILVNKVLEKLESYPPECHLFLERCLRIVNYSVEKAVKLVEDCIYVVKALNDVFQLFQVSLIEIIISSRIFSVLRSRDEKGRLIVHAQMGNWKPDQITYEQLASGLIMFSCWLMGKTPETQRNGVVIIHDMRNYSLEQLRGLKFSLVTRIVTLLQRGAPGRIEAIHVINYPTIMWYIYKVVSPFIKEELSKRIYFHGDDNFKLQQHIHPEILPLELGGNLKKDDAVDTELVGEFFSESTQYHADIMRYGIPRF